ncbi:MULTISPECIES: orotidine-5'-phosphate decarboxylase [unclassified Limnobacter]|uniref:orotidine-5'-phosphate decarboxylase n=1 Tax=unclassified Limnobacter TaxID=2630203 RepID=UPI000C3644F9|nr:MULTISPECIES: orotidine-5'-phosphate decarboxylase [unclassified Limnobacter]MAZ11152.1 orotidine-5'-phosphate decarboxylase [Sutterellaceae bacterium]
MASNRFTQFTSFPKRLAHSWQHSNSMLCVGLDPDVSRMPEGYGTSPAEIERFCMEIVKATAEFACAFKPQIAYFAANRAEAALENILAYANEIAPHATTILDAKRGDIGATAKQYAIEAFERYKADSVTLSPYMGSDSVEPYHAYADRGLFLLCRTSNPGGNDLQFLNTEKNEPLYQTVAKLATTTWNPHQQVGLVVGATYPEEIKTVRALVGDSPLLVPGIGAQGGDLLNTVKNGLCSQGWGLLINSSRAILYASSKADFAGAAAQEARNTRDAIQATKAVALSG